MERKPQMNQDAVRIMKELYDIDMEANGQYSKLITEIPGVTESNSVVTVSFLCVAKLPL